MRPLTSPSLRPRYPTLALILITGIFASSTWAQSSPAAPVVVVSAHLEHVIESLSLTGTVTARQQAALSPRTSGLVESVQVDAGSYVEQGADLVRLDATLAQLAAESAEADLIEAQARLTESKRLLEEGRRLLTNNSIPETEVMNRKANVAFATASARRADVTHRESLERLARHTVVAPFAGVITRKLTEAGEWVSTGAPVLQLVGLKGARVDVQVPQERLAAITAQTPVEFALDTTPLQPIKGHITARVPVSNPSTRSALIRIEPLDAAAVLPPGKSVRVTFLIQSDAPVLTVPRDSLVRRADGTVNIWVAQADGDQWKAAARRVDLGRTYSDQVEVLSGLDTGERIIIRGNETVREGQPLRLVDSAN